MKIKINNYTFNKATKTITFTDYVSVSLDSVLLVVDTTNKKTIYQFDSADLSGTVSGNVLTLNTDTTGSEYANTDKLAIYFDDALAVTKLDSTLQTITLSGNTVGSTSSGIITKDFNGATVMIRSGSATGGVLVFEGSILDAPGTNDWSAIPFKQLSTNVSSLSTATLSVNTTYLFQLQTYGLKYLRIRVSTALAATPAYINCILSQEVPDVTPPLISTQAVTLATTTVSAPSASVAGTTIGKVLSAASTNATALKTSAGRLLGVHISNTSAATKYLKFFNKASAPTLGTDVPVFSLPVLPNDRVDFEAMPITFSTGIAYAITAAAADNDNTAVAANDVIGFINYV